MLSRIRHRLRRRERASVTHHNDIDNIMSKPFEHKPGTGSLFPNDRKQAENHPDWKGEINIDGKVYEIASWWKEGKRGGFHSLRVSEKKPFDGNAVRRESREEYPRREARAERQHYDRSHREREEGDPW